LLTKIDPTKTMLVANQTQGNFGVRSNTNDDGFFLTEAGEEAVLVYMEVATFVHGLKGQGATSVSSSMQATGEALSGIANAASSRIHASTQAFSDIIEPASDEAKILAHDVSTTLVNVIEPAADEALMIAADTAKHVKRSGKAVGVAIRSAAEMHWSVMRRVRYMKAPTSYLAEAIEPARDEAKLIYRELSESCSMSSKPANRSSNPKYSLSFADAIEPAKEEASMIYREFSESFSFTSRPIKVHSDPSCSSSSFTDVIDQAKEESSLLHSELSQSFSFTVSRRNTEKIANYSNNIDPSKAVSNDTTSTSSSMTAEVESYDDSCYKTTTTTHNFESSTTSSTILQQALAEMIGPARTNGGLV